MLELGGIAFPAIPREAPEITRPLAIGALRYECESMNKDDQLHADISLSKMHPRAPSTCTNITPFGRVTLCQWSTPQATRQRPPPPQPKTGHERCQGGNTSQKWAVCRHSPISASLVSLQAKQFTQIQGHHSGGDMSVMSRAVTTIWRLTETTAFIKLQCETGTEVVVMSLALHSSPASS